ncbi:hypothetical protein Tco_1515593 [Tanacetum coccineum]
MAPKRNQHLQNAPAMTHAAIRKLVADSTYVRRFLGGIGSFDANYGAKFLEIHESLHRRITQKYRRKCYRFKALTLEEAITITQRLMISVDKAQSVQELMIKIEVLMIEEPSPITTTKITITTTTPATMITTNNRIEGKKPSGLCSPTYQLKIVGTLQIQMGHPWESKPTTSILNLSMHVERKDIYRNRVQMQTTMPMEANLLRDKTLTKTQNARKLIVPGIHDNPSKIEAVKNLSSPTTTPIEVQPIQ